MNDRTAQRGARGDEPGSLTPIAESAWCQAEQIGDVQAGAAVLGGPVAQSDDAAAEELFALTQRSLPGMTTPEIVARFGRQAPPAQAVQVFFFLPDGRPRFAVGVFFCGPDSCTTRGSVRAISSRARAARNSRSWAASWFWSD